MKTNLILLSFAFLLFALPSNAQNATIAGVSVPLKIKAGESSLDLNGGGVREKYWIDLYVGGLYVGQKGQSAQDYINGDETIGIYMHIVSGLITSDKMVASVKEGFTNATNGNTKPIQSEIDQVIKAFSDPIAKGDIIKLVYVKGEGTHFFKNGKKMDTIKGLAFKKALFGIWLGKKPASAPLKEGMLKGSVK